jgi:hypothetical protein
VIWPIKHPDDNQTAKAEHLIAPVLRKAQHKQLVV